MTYQELVRSIQELPFMERLSLLETLAAVTAGGYAPQTGQTIVIGLRSWNAEG